MKAFDNRTGWFPLVILYHACSPPLTLLPCCPMANLFSVHLSVLNKAHFQQQGPTIVGDQQISNYRHRDSTVNNQKKERKTQSPTNKGLQNQRILVPDWVSETHWRWICTATQCFLSQTLPMGLHEQWGGVMVFLFSLPPPPPFFTGLVIQKDHVSVLLFFFLLYLLRLLTDVIWLFFPV